MAPKNARLFAIIIAIVFIIGAALWCIGHAMPIYTDPKGPVRLSAELERHPREVRFREWYSQLRSIETPHKRLTDIGRGLMALALGAILAAGIIAFYQHFSGVPRLAFIVIVWLALWALKIPFAFWYYGLRQKRFDYPVWGDSIGIPVMSETFTWITGAFVSGAMLLVLMIGYKLGTALWPLRPRAVWAWMRTVAIGVWLLLIIACILLGILDGDEGTVISCQGAIPVLLAVLSASPHRSTRS